MENGKTRDLNDLPDWQKIGILGLFFGTLLLIGAGLGELTEFFIDKEWIVAAWAAWWFTFGYFFWLLVLTIRLAIMSFKSKSD